MLLIGSNSQNYVFKNTAVNEEIVEIPKNRFTYSQAQHYYNQGWTPQMLGINPNDFMIHDEAFVIRFKLKLNVP